MILGANSLSTVQSYPYTAASWSESQLSWPCYTLQVNGHSSGPAAHSGKALREDLQEFLGQEAPLHLLDDLTKVNPVTLETGTGLPLLKSAISKSVALWCRYSAQLPLARQGRQDSGPGARYAASDQPGKCIWAPQYRLCSRFGVHLN